jgi:prephenate dehydrogenase
MAIQLTVIGLNQVGVSIGLALQNNSEEIERIGSDAEYSYEQKALKLKAFDRVIHNLPKAVENADIVVLCVPVDEIRFTLEVIAPVLKSGAVILDTSPLNIALFQWAKDLLLEERFLVNFKPSLNPEFIVYTDDIMEKATPELFKSSVILINAPPETHADALKLAGDLASLIGAKPYYTDPYESDGLSALVGLLPKFTAAALVLSATHQPGWREGRKLAGQAFYSASEPLMHLDEHKKLGQAAVLNSDNTVRLLDGLIAELGDLRDMIENQDEEALNNALSEALENRMTWWKERQNASWDLPASSPIIPTSRQMLGRLFGLGKRPREDSKSKKESKYK